MVEQKDEWTSSVFLALGSNMGDASTNIKRAIEKLQQNENVRLLKSSSMYVTEAWGSSSLNDFHNMVVEVATKLNPQQLLDLCLQVESNLGRSRSEAKGYENRLIDIDLIFFEHFSCKTETLQLPHPYWSSRNFVLQPLNEIASNFIPYNGNKKIADFVADCKDDLKVVKLE